MLRRTTSANIQSILDVVIVADSHITPELNTPP